VTGLRDPSRRPTETEGGNLSWPYHAGAVAVVLLCVLAPVVRAHPISISWAYVTVQKSKISVRLEIMPEDLYLYHSIEATGEGYFAAADVRVAIEAHREFLLEHFVIRDSDGDRLSGRIARVEPFEMGPKGLRMTTLMEGGVVYHLEFDLESPPALLTIYQQFGGEQAVVPAILELRVRRERGEWRGPVELTRGVRHTVSFDWSRPPLAASPQDTEERRARERERTLGITRYDSVYSFIYITDYEVRHEILIPLLTLEMWLPVGRRDRTFLGVEEQEAAREPIGAFFAGRNPVEVDGIRVKPTLVGLDFYGPDFRDFARQAVHRRVKAYAARVGVILSYSTKGAPSRVKIRWDMLNVMVYEVNSAVYAYHQNLRHVFSSYNSVFEWTSPGRPPPPEISELQPPLRQGLALPVVSLACLLVFVGALIWSRRTRVPTKRHAAVSGVICLAAAVVAWPYARVAVPDPLRPRFAISEEDAGAVFASLHRNVYRAFDYRSESDIYDALERSVAGGLLSKLYLQVRTGLEMQEQGGAVSRIREVKIIEGRKETLKRRDTRDPRGFGYRCTWTVEGTVEHWGHIHKRVNRYEALFAVQARHNAWKITGFQVLDAKRLKSETSLRR